MTIISAITRRQICHLWCLCCLIFLPFSPLSAEEKPAPAENKTAELSGTEIVKRCGYKPQGADQRSKFVVVVRNNEGLVRRSEYLRYWKDFKGVEGVADKMLLFTTYPPEAKGSAFMRVAYTSDHERQIDQWIYLPQMRKIRRVSIRDPGDSFLNSNLTYADVSPRALDEDEHHFLGIKEMNNLKFYMVDSIPKEKKPLYSKRTRYFLKNKNWDECVNTRIDYYDSDGSKLKEQFINWKKVGTAWVWDRVLVHGLKSFDASVFQNSHVSIDTGLDAEVFSARTLRKGPGVIPGVIPGVKPGQTKKEPTPDKDQDKDKDKDQTQNKSQK